METMTRVLLRRLGTIKDFSSAVALLHVCCITLLLVDRAVLIQTTDSWCPHGCLCRTNEQVVCQDSGIEKVPENLSPTTLYLSVTRSQIQEIPSQAFRSLSRLKRLALDNNKITHIAAEAFLGLGNMEELSLQNNPLTSITPGAFSGLFNIRNVFLGYNKITEIQERAFFGSEGIKSLSLHGNPLKMIRSGAFRGLKNVDYIHLPYQISHIEQRAFYGLSNVSNLQFDALDTKAILPSTFEGLSGVSHLSIRGSQIGAIKSGAFMRLNNVDTLTIDSSSINTIEGRAFANMYEVHNLFIVSNKVNNFHPSALDGLTHSQVKSIVVKENLVPCDCRIHWFQRDHTLVVPDIMNDNNCSEPEELQGRTLSSVPLEGLELCSPSEISFYSDNSAHGSPGLAMRRKNFLSSILIYAMVILLKLIRTAQE